MNRKTGKQTRNRDKTGMHGNDGSRSNRIGCSIQGGNGHLREYGRQRRDGSECGSTANGHVGRTRRTSRRPSSLRRPGLFDRRSSGYIPVIGVLRRFGRRRDGKVPWAGNHGGGHDPGASVKRKVEFGGLSLGRRTRWQRRQRPDLDSASGS